MFNAIETGSFNEMAFRSNFPIHRACRDGDVATLCMILQKNASLATAEEPFRGWTPMHWAAYFGKVDCLRQIASVEPNFVNIQSSKSFQTPAHCASEGSQPLCLMWLLQTGANPEVKDNLGETALHKAAKMGSAECVSLLINASCNISVQNSDGQTASTLALIGGYPAIANFIRKHELGINALVPKLRCQESFEPVRLNRKRSHDMMCEGAVKRTRTDDISLKMPIAFPETLTNVIPMTASVVEHEKMCRMECGYTNTMFECYFNDYHGC